MSPTGTSAVTVRLGGSAMEDWGIHLEGAVERSDYVVGCSIGVRQAIDCYRRLFL